MKFRREDDEEYNFYPEQKRQPPLQNGRYAGIKSRVAPIKHELVVKEYKPTLFFQEMLEETKK